MIVTFNQLKEVRRSSKGKKIVFAGGVFDLIHKGHIEYLKQLKELGDILVIGLSSDRRVKERKGFSRPILSEDERAIIVDAIRYVDYTVIIPESDIGEEVPTLRVMKELSPEIFASTDKSWLEFKDKIKELGIEFKLISIQKINSTTEIIQKVINSHR